MQDIGKVLQNELTRRQRNNSAYSLRSFARFLDVSPATLSQIISGKRGISFKKLNAILDKLGLTPLEQKSKIPRKTKTLKEDQFKLISEWYHYAILGLGDLADNSADPRWIARRLNISVNVANQALSRLERLGLIEVKNGQFKQVTAPLKTTSDVPSGTIRRYHKGILGLAQNRIDQVDVKEREYSSITMAINTKNLAKAKKLTQEYKEEMLELLEKGPLDEVYQLSIQLFPLSVKGVK